MIIFWILIFFGLLPFGWLLAGYVALFVSSAYRPINKMKTNLVTGFGVVDERICIVISQPVILEIEFTFSPFLLPRRTTVFPAETKRKLHEILQAHQRIHQECITVMY